MTSPDKTDQMLERLESIDQAITNLKRGKKKLSIAQIAKKAGIARKTIYNHSKLKERCDQAIHIQELENESIDSKKSKPISGRKLLEQRYEKSKDSLKKEREKNAKLLENNRQLVLEKAQLKSRIEMLQQQNERLRNQKVTPMR